VAYLLHPDLYDPPPEIDEWMLLQAAKWAGVPPWELYDQPAAWLLSIWEAMETENDIKKQLSGKPKKKD
jgi:hypothetical protein